MSRQPIAFLKAKNFITLSKRRYKNSCRNFVDCSAVKHGMLKEKLIPQKLHLNVPSPIDPYTVLNGVLKSVW